MRGTKRLGVSDSTPDTNSSFLQSKKVMVGPQIEFQTKSMGTPSLDMHRAELSRQHVRALNNQFASWVQTQLQNHPDELWEDGVRDYLSYASNIMEKFSDVVNWLKSNSTKTENSLDHAAPKKLVTESKEVTNVPLQETTMTTQPSATVTTSSFTNSWSTWPLVNAQPSNNTQSTFNTQSSSIFGGQSLFSVKPDASNDADDDDEVKRPSSPSVKKTEEIGISVVHEVKCKLYIKSTDPADKDAWKDKGTGQLSIKCKDGVTKGTKDSKPTVLVRNDVGRLLLNALLYPGIKTSLQKNSIVAIFHTADDNENESSKVIARTYLIRTKSKEDRDKLAAAIKEYAPAA